MDKLKFCKNNKLFLGEQEVKRDSVNFTEFLVANLDSEIDFEEGLTIEELIHFFYDCREFIYSYFSEHYEVLRAFLTVKNLNNHYHAFKICKKIHIDEEYIIIIPSIDFILPKEGESRTNALGKIVVILDDQLSLMEDDLFSNQFDDNRNLKKKMRSRITLQDCMRSLFEDLVSILEENIINL